MKIVATLALASLAMSVGACNTVAGVGRDVAYTGGSIVKWSQDMRDGIPDTGFAGEEAQRFTITAQEELDAQDQAQAESQDGVAYAVPVVQDRTISKIEMVGPNGARMIMHDEEAADQVARDATQSVQRYNESYGQLGRY